MTLQNILLTKVKEAVHFVFNVNLPTVEFQNTKKDFEGDLTIVLFPMLRFLKNDFQTIGQQIGNYLERHTTEVQSFNVVKGFLNVVISDTYYLQFLNTMVSSENYGKVAPNSKPAFMVEYASPNTNKPLHLGHIRNILLGDAVAEILKASGNKVYKTQIINDRGIHICKSMLAWKKFANGESPQTTGIKGDKLVGNYYIAFNEAYRKDVQMQVAAGISKEEAEKKAPILLESQHMLQKWEAGDKEVTALWKKMNGWVYDGFAITYRNLGVKFDVLYYESNTYLLGKEFVKLGLEKGIFFQKQDGSVWCDLTAEGLDEKIVLRADGTAVYITQDIGTAIQRAKDYEDVKAMVYTVGNEQDYHFKVLFLILKKMQFPWASQLYHLSYGMVDLPSGKMKSREGTVIDADDLLEEMTQIAKQISKEKGNLEGFTEAEKQRLYKMIGIGALKYFILKVDPKKGILFHPKKSVDFNGNTGPFIQYTYARIQSILRRSTQNELTKEINTLVLHQKEKELIKTLILFPEIIQQAATQYNPSLIANYTYDLVKSFNSFYQNVSILGAEEQNVKCFRIQLSKKVGWVVKSAFSLLGIGVPDKM